MYKAQTRPRNDAADDELIEVLIAISIVSMRLARKLTLLAMKSQSKEGGKANERHDYDHRRTAQRRCSY
ncbi:MAG: hypothetical protein ACYC5K_13255 [Saccharofermentanales bacterium]